MGSKLIPNTPNDEDDDGETVEVGGGTFTQEQVNALMRDRLSRQKRALEAKYSKQINENADAAEQLVALTEKAKKYDALFKAGLEDRRKKLPEGVLTLLDKLEPGEQLEWLNANADKLTSVKPDAGPQTPKPKDTTPNESATLEHKSQSNRYQSM